MRTMLAAWMVLMCGAAASAGIFDVKGGKAERIVITVGEEQASRPEPSSEMLDTLLGVVHVLDAQEAAKLKQASEGVGAKMVTLTGELPAVCYAHCWKGAEERVVRIGRDTDGAFVAQDVRDPAIKPVRLAPGVFEQLALTWPRYRGNFAAPAGMKPGVAGELAQPYVQGWFTFDKATLGKRFLNGRSTNIPGTTRDLANETLLMRLPKAFEPTKQYGLIVWIDANTTARLYEPLFEACDREGFVLVGAQDTGNGRPTAERFQLALDAMATASAGVLIDPERVYVSGLSGGGKISTHLWACVPELVKGAVPIVGLASYRDVPAGPGLVWKGDFQKPSDLPRLNLVKKHRCGVLTGDKDFNLVPIRGTAEMMVRDGLPVKVFEHEGMAHELPRPEHYLEALQWVDMGAKEKRELDCRKAAAAIAGLDAGVMPGAAKPQGAALTPAQRQTLVDATTTAPWSDAAWEAVERLKIRGGR